MAAELTTTPAITVAVFINFCLFFASIHPHTSNHAVRWAVDHYLRPGYTVMLLHVRPTSGLYGADFGSALEEEDGIDEEGSWRRMEERAKKIGRALEDAGLEYGVRIVNDKEMKERVCLEYCT